MSKKRLQKQQKLTIAISAILLVAVIISYTDFMRHRRATIDPSTYASLLGVIAKAESKGNYNAYFGNANNSSINFTAMTIAQVVEWQKNFVQQGNPSSAVGKYQILNTTLIGLVDHLNLDTDRHFDKQTQDTLAIALLERRGAEKYINKEITKQEFAANLAKEWAGLPKVIGNHPDKSYYDADGLNKSRVSVDEVIAAIEPIKAR